MIQNTKNWNNDTKESWKEKKPVLISCRRKVDCPVYSKQAN